MKITVNRGRLRITLFVGLRFAFLIARIAVRKNAAARKFLSSCSKDIIRECKRYKRRNGSLTVVEAYAAEGDRVSVKL